LQSINRRLIAAGARIASHPTEQTANNCMIHKNFFFRAHFLPHRTKSG
jgi:hypothetical protein